MPLILTPVLQKKWLDNLNRNEISQLMQPLEDGLLKAHKISKLITSRNQDRNVPAVQEEVPSDTLF